MTVTLVFRFTWGRYHATPWGRHVNEGAVELPPSPWRLLRALYAVWKTRAPDLAEVTVHELLRKLAGPPEVFVPAHTLAHTRHYYPDTKHTRAAHSVDSTVDAFAVLDPQSELAVRWRGVELSTDERTALEKLSASTPYLGRADSVCEARVDESWQPDRHAIWQELGDAESIADDAEVTTVLAPDKPLNLDTLVARPVDVRKQKLLFPIGTKLIAYQRVQDTPHRRRRVRIPRRPVHTVRFEIAQRVLPRAADTLVYTDLLRSTALSWLGKTRPGKKHTVLGGKTADAAKSEDNHKHAHYLPILENRRLVALVVWAPAGIQEDELDALLQVRRLWADWTDKWRSEVRVAGVGDGVDVAPELYGPCRVWRSVTPFAPRLRYPKPSWDRHRLMLAGIRRELRYRGHPDTSVDIEVLPGERGFRKSRLSKTEECGPSDHLRLTFDQPMTGPLALGHLSHFGLGLFVPDKD